MKHASGSDRRPKRLAEQIRQVVTAFLQGEARDPRIGLVTVTGVDLTGDLQRAVVRYVVHGTDEQRAQTREGLTAAAAAVRRRLADALSVRLVPEVIFEPDRGLEHAARIQQLLADLHRPGEGAG
jgi:ribosome-binding factor A